MNDNSKLIGYGIVALIAAVVLYHTWQFIIGGLALIGAFYVLSSHSKHR